MSDITTPAQPAKRKARTLEEREAALQAELNSLRAKARVQDKLKLKALGDKLSKLNTRIEKIETERDELIVQIKEITARLGDRGELDE